MSSLTSFIILIIILLSLLGFLSSSLYLVSVTTDLLTFVGVILLFFNVSCAFALRFVHLRPSHWLEVLIICRLAV
jgi:hypothetical protein